MPRKTSPVRCSKQQDGARQSTERHGERECHPASPSGGGAQSPSCLPGIFATPWTPAEGRQLELRRAGRLIGGRAGRLIGGRATAPGTRRGFCLMQPPEVFEPCRRQLGVAHRIHGRANVAESFKPLYRFALLNIPAHYNATCGHREEHQQNYVSSSRSSVVRPPSPRPASRSA